jgi:hypothetical protein
VPSGHQHAFWNTQQLSRCCTYDVVVIDAAPAGMHMAVRAVLEGRRAAALDSLSQDAQADPSGCIGQYYLGFPAGIFGHGMSRLAFAQSQKFVVHISIPVEAAGFKCGAVHSRIGDADALMSIPCAGKAEPLAGPGMCRRARTNGEPPPRRNIAGKLLAH